MKTILTTLVGVMLCMSLQGQSQVNKLIDTVKDHPKSITMTVPGWMINMALKAIKLDDVSKDEEVWLSIADRIKRIRFSFVPEMDGIDVEDLGRRIGKIKEKHHFEEYARVKSDGNRVNVLVKEKKGSIKNVFLYVRGEDGVGAIHFKTDIDPEIFKSADFSFNKN